MICPICKNPVDNTGSEYPFCSERCRTIDLGNWASEKYVVSEPLDPGDTESLANQHGEE